MSRLIPLAALLVIAGTPAIAQIGGTGLSGGRASTGSVSSSAGSTLNGTGTASSGSGLGLGLGSGTLTGSSSASNSGSLPEVSGSGFGQAGTPLGSQSSLGARVNAAAGLTTASRLNQRLATGSAAYGSSGGAGLISPNAGNAGLSGLSIGGGAISGLSPGTTLENAGQPAGAPLGRRGN